MKRTLSKKLHKMKPVLVLLVISFFIHNLLVAQVPQAINYQGVARNSGGSVLANQSVSLRMSILSDSALGTTVYAETHALVTDAYGLFLLQIGKGTVVTGVFNTITWGSKPQYLKVEIDPSGGSDYSLLGTNQFVSVPYALHSKSTDAISPGQNPGDMLYWNGTQWIRIPVGTNGQFLTLTGGIPSWGQASANVPSIITTAISGITQHTAISGGNVSDGGAPVTAKGVCWSTSANPTIGNSKTTDGNGTGSFTSNIGGLAPGTTYFVRAYATNSVGTGYGNQLSFSTVQGSFRSGIFLHHSTGGNIWGPNGSSTSVPEEMDTYNTAHSFTGPDVISMNEEWWSPGDNEWSTQHEFFEGNTAYTDINQYLLDNKILVVKSCFPASSIQSWGQPSDTNSPAYKTVYNYKWHWRHIVNVMKSHPENFFVIWTNAPLEPNSTNAGEANLSNKFCTWAKDTLASGLDPVFGAFPSNVYVFDFFHKLTGPNGMMLIQYRASSGDSHPNATATALVAPQFVQESFDAAIGYETAESENHRGNVSVGKKEETKGN